VKPVASNPSRSRLLGLVRQTGTAAELSVGRALRKLGLFYRKNVRALPGSPDFANRAACWAVFVNGCFWHAHTGCRRATLPKSNHEFWISKFTRNRSRDAAAIRALRAAGFRVVVIWECELTEVEAHLSKIIDARNVDMAEPIDR
jgi:DNA mismatch endonuclease, patch repair protein